MDKNDRIHWETLDGLSTGRLLAAELLPDERHDGGLLIRYPKKRETYLYVAAPFGALGRLRASTEPVACLSEMQDRGYFKVCRTINRFKYVLRSLSVVEDILAHTPRAGVATPLSASYRPLAGAAWQF